jgi:translation initiation factor 4E
MMSSFSPFATRWCLWELRPVVEGSPADLDASVHYLGSFGTLDEFWAIWSRLPRISDLFSDGSSVFRKGVIHEDNDTASVDALRESKPAVLVDGYAMFREGVKPLWEDTRNIRGGEWSCRKGAALDV